MWYLIVVEPKGGGVPGEVVVLPHAVQHGHDTLPAGGRTPAILRSTTLFITH